MPYDLYSKRLRKAARALSGEPDVYHYDDLHDSKFRIQVMHLVDRVIYQADKARALSEEVFYERVNQGLCEATGRLSLLGSFRTAKGEVLNYIRLSRWEDALDAIEFTFYSMNSISQEYSRSLEYSRGRFPTDRGFVYEAVDTLNERFRENDLGYQLENYQLIRVDSQYIHAEVVKPALKLLADPQYEGADEEFRSAFHHYTHSRGKECLNDCLKAFESTLKIICEKRQWNAKSDKASHLVQTCINNGLIPGYLSSYLEGVSKTLGGGIAPLRNEAAAHGQGAIPVEVPNYLVRYGLNTTATAILLLVEADQTFDRQA